MRRPSRASRVAIGLALLLALPLAISGCDGGAATATPTKGAAPATARGNTTIVTDLSNVQMTPDRKSVV